MNFRGKKQGILTGASALTTGERLLLLRERDGIHQDEAARRLGIGERAYNAAETDRGAFTGRLRALGSLSDEERFAITRRRSKLPLADVARLLKVSRVTILAMERRGDAKLKAFWEKRGFRF